MPVIRWRLPRRARPRRDHSMVKGPSVSRTSSSEEKITYALRQHEAGTAAADICRQLRVSEATFYVWKKKYTHMGVSELQELRQLREENARLKRLVADLTLDKQILTDVVKDAVHDVSACVATNAGTYGIHRHAHGAGYTGAELLHTVTSGKRLEHRSGDEASRACACPSGGRQYRPQDLRRRGNGSRRSIKSREYAAAGANSTSDWTWPAVRLFAPI